MLKELIKLVKCFLGLRRTQIGQEGSLISQKGKEAIRLTIRDLQSAVVHCYER